MTIIYIWLGASLLLSFVFFNRQSNLNDLYNLGITKIRPSQWRKGLGVLFLFSAGIAGVIIAVAEVLGRL